MRSSCPLWGEKKKPQCRSAGEGDGESDGEDSAEREHVERLERACALGREGQAERYGAARQIERRRAECAARRRAVEFHERHGRCGASMQAVAGVLGRPPRTLGYWRRLAREGRLGARLRGRPLRRLSPGRRNALIGFLREAGPGIGLERLREQAPGATRASVREVLGRFRRVYLRRNRLLVHELTWNVPGSVWAIDHAVAPGPIDGAFEAVLAVRDLASGEELLWEPCVGMTAAEAVCHLECLVAARGAPLVVKSDNGAAFSGGEMAALAGRFGFLQLFSPPRTPEYNGAIEAGIGAMKRRTNYQAARAGRVGQWRTEDLERAQALANAHYVRRERRERVSEESRRAFGREVAAREAKLLEEIALEPEDAGGIMSPGTARRRAITGALHAHGFLTTRRRRVSLPLKSIFRAKIL